MVELNTLLERKKEKIVFRANKSITNPTFKKIRLLKRVSMVNRVPVVVLHFKQLLKDIEIHSKNFTNF